MLGAPAIPGGRKPLRTMWSFADGTTVGPDDDKSTSELFRKMIKGLSSNELRLLDDIVQRELFAKANPSARPESALGPVTVLACERAKIDILRTGAPAGGGP
jgi:hypothetical protein